MNNLKTRNILQQIDKINFLDEGGGKQYFSKKYASDFVRDCYGFDFEKGGNTYVLVIERAGNRKKFYVRRATYNMLRVVIWYLLKEFYAIIEVFEENVQFFEGKTNLEIRELLLTEEDQIVSVIYRKEINNRIAWEVTEQHRQQFLKLLRKINEEVEKAHTLLNQKHETANLKIENNLITLKQDIYNQKELSLIFRDQRILKEVEEILDFAYPAL